ncbi:MAG: aminotransferase class IV [Lawsonibacter sp.]
MWKNVGYYNGEIGPLEEMKVSMGDQALCFGDGIYEAACVANRVPFALEDHLDRMYNSLQFLEIPFQRERDLVRRNCRRSSTRRRRARSTFCTGRFTGGVAQRESIPCRQRWPSLLAYVRPHGMKYMDQPYRLISLEDNRYKLYDIKTLNLIPSVLANQRAAERGCDEAVLHRGCRVTECAHSNISMLKDGVLRTAPTDELILPGIARKHFDCAGARARGSGGGDPVLHGGADERGRSHRRQL